MFQMGLLLLLLGSIFVYGASFLLSLIRINRDWKIYIKILGMVLAIVGMFFIFYGEFPDKLQFIRLFKRKGVFK